MKKLLLPLLGILFLTACEKDLSTPAISETNQTIEFRAKKDKIDVCHYDTENDTWHVINISENAWSAHEGHGDIRLDDQDDDGYVPDNECGFGDMGDCDDNNEFINPGADEDCENEIDDDCDGDIDETDEDCCQNKHVRDEFTSVSFNNNDGIDNWNSAWIENDSESGGSGPSAGQVQVLNGELRFDDQPDTSSEPSASREINLSGGVSATFSFDFKTTAGVDPDDAIGVDASINGGASWTVLETITGISGISTDSRSFDITAFISPNTTIRFRVSNFYGGFDEYFFVDNVQIISSCN